MADLSGHLAKLASFAWRRNGSSSWRREKNLGVVQEEIFRLKGESKTTENLLEFQRKEILNFDRQQTRIDEESASLRRQLAEAEAEI